MQSNNDKKNWKIEFLDCYGDTLYDDIIRNKAFSELEPIIIEIMPISRHIEDYKITEIMNTNQINQQEQQKIVEKTNTGYIPKNVGFSGMGGGVILNNNNQYVPHVSILNKVNQN